MQTIRHPTRGRRFTSGDEVEVMINRNLGYLEREYFRRTSASIAFANFAKWSDDRLRCVLRHHDETEEGISDSETWWRDEFDYLLAFYGIVEIAVMIGFVAELPAAFC